VTAAFRVQEISSEARSSNTQLTPACKSTPLQDPREQDSFVNSMSRRRSNFGMCLLCWLRSICLCSGIHFLRHSKLRRVRAVPHIWDSPPRHPNETQVPHFWFSSPLPPNECGEAIPFVDLHHKLVVCTTPKAGSTAMRTLLAHIRKECIKDEQCRATVAAEKVQPKCKQELLRLSDLDSPTASRILQDPSFLRIAIVRNPVLRYLSAFLMFHKRPFFANATFSQFVREEVMEQRDCSMDTVLTIPAQPVDHCFSDPINRGSAGEILRWEPAGWWRGDPNIAVGTGTPGGLGRRCPHYGGDLDNVVQHWYPQHCRYAGLSYTLTVLTHTDCTPTH
jgi:hypothetical protein